jgi:hypothetical protein
MSVLGLMAKWFGGQGRRNVAAVRKPVRVRLALEGLEERTLQPGGRHPDVRALRLRLH